MDLEKHASERSKTSSVHSKRNRPTFNSTSHYKSEKIKRQNSFQEVEP